jgi:hypothetical protein
MLVNGRSRGFILRPVTHRVIFAAGGRARTRVQLPTAVMRHVMMRRRSCLTVRINDAAQALAATMYVVDVNPGPA